MFLSSGISGAPSFASLNEAHNRFNKSLEKLVTGLKINRAGDDSAGLSIASKLTIQIQSRDSVFKNIGDGISASNTAGAGLSAIANDLQRIRELSVQAANETNSPDELNAIQAEVDALKGNIDDFASDTKFNGINLLDGSGGVTEIVTDTDGGSLDLDYSGDFSSGALGVSTIDVTVPGGASAALNNIDLALEGVTAKLSELGAKENALDSIAEFNSIKQEAAFASRSRIIDTDTAGGLNEFQAAKVQAKLASSFIGLNQSLIMSLLPK